MEFESVRTQIASVMNVTVPVPDMVLILAGLLGIAVVSISARRSQQAAVEHAENLYLEELTRATRQAHAAESKLRAAQSEVERYRRRSKGH